MVERNVANVEVASSRLVSRSKNATPRTSWPERPTRLRGSRESLHVRVSVSSQLAAEDSLPRPAETGEESGDEWLGWANVHIGPIDRRCLDLDEDFVVLGHGPLDVVESQNIGGSVPVVDDGSHPAASLRHWHR